MFGSNTSGFHVDGKKRSHHEVSKSMHLQPTPAITKTSHSVDRQSDSDDMSQNKGSIRALSNKARSKNSPEKQQNSKLP